MSSESPPIITRDTHFYSDSEDARRPRSEFLDGFAAYLRNLSVSDNASSFDEQRQRERAQQMHAMIGNRNPRRPRRNREAPNPPTVKAAIKEEVRHEVKKEAAKENKQARRQRRPVTVRKGQKVVVRGSGDYELGTNIGSRIGGWLGSRIHKWVGGLFGHGDYEVVQPGQGINSNSLMASASMPQFSGEVGVVRYRFSEWLGYAPVETKFTPTTYPIDCTSRRTFPYSHPIARLFQQYKIHGLIFAVNSNMSIYSNAPTLGTLFGSVRYDVDSQPPTSKNEVMNSLFSATAKSAGNLVFPVECAPGQTALQVFKVRQPGRAAGDEQFYMLGYFDLCSDGAAIAAPKGCEVTAVYDVEFVKPRLEAGAGFYVFMADCKCNESTTPLAYIPNSAVVTQPRLNTAGITTTDDGVITFPYDYEAGTLFKVTYSFINAANGISTAVGNLKHLTTPPFAYNQSAASLTSGPATASGIFFSNITVFVVRMTGTATVKDPPTLKIAYAGAMTGPGLLLIEEIDPRVASGLVSIDEEPYTRQEFIEYLENVQVGSEGIARAPDYSVMRLVDVVDALMRSPQIILGAIERCNIEYDIGVTEALDRLKVYRTKPRLVPMDATLPPVCVRKNLSYVPIDEKGAEGEEILMMASPELIRSFGLVTKRQLNTLGARAKARVTHDGRTFYIPEEDFEVASQISGANGEWTGTDDVQPSCRSQLSGSHGEWTMADDVRRGAALPREGATYTVNPEGSTLREGVWKSRSFLDALAKDAHPGRGFIRDGDLFFAVDGCDCKDGWLVPRRAVDMNYRVMRKIQCFFITGKVCTHHVWQCPGHRRIQATCYADQAPREPDAFHALNGANGSYTGTDDVFQVCVAPCNRPLHYHRLHRQALSGAARRVRESQQRPSRPIYLACANVTECKEPDHYHPTTRGDFHEAYMSNGQPHSESHRTNAIDPRLYHRSLRDQGLIAQSLARTMDDVDGAFDALAEAAAAAADEDDGPVLEPLIAPASDGEELKVDNQTANAPTIVETVVQPIIPHQARGNARWQRVTTPGTIAPPEAPARAPPTADPPQPPPEPELVRYQTRMINLMRDIMNSQNFTDQWAAMDHHGAIAEYEAMAHDRASRMVAAGAIEGSAVGDVIGIYRARMLVLERIRENARERAEALDIGVLFSHHPPAIGPPEEEELLSNVFERHFGLLDGESKASTAESSSDPTAECPVCRSPMRQPTAVMYPCSHFFCCSCASTMNARLMRCPMCRLATTPVEIMQSTLSIDPAVYSRWARSNTNADENEAKDDSGREQKEPPILEQQPEVQEDQPLVPVRDLRNYDAIFRRQRARPPPAHHSDGILIPPLTGGNSRRTRNFVPSIQEHIDREAAVIYRLSEHGYNHPDPLNRCVRPGRDWTNDEWFDYTVWRPIEESGLLFGIRHPVAYGVSRAINLITLPRTSLLRLTCEPSDGRGAPTAPPFDVRVIGDLPLQAVTLYSTVDADVERPWHQKAWRWIRSRKPLQHATVEFHPGDQPTNLSINGNFVLTSATALGFRRGFISVDHTSPLVDTPTATTVRTAMLASLYRSVYPGYVYPSLFEYLFTTTNDRLVSLNTRSAALFEGGKFSMRTAFIGAVKRVVAEHPQYAVYLANGVQNLDDTIHYYAQQRYLREIREIQATGTPRSVDFQVGGQSSASWTTGAPTGAGVPMLNGQVSYTTIGSGF